MRVYAVFSCLLFLCGCTTTVPNYIKSDHPYGRKMYGEFTKIDAAVRNVLVHQGWKIVGQADPSTYERGDEEATDKDILLFTNVKQHPMVLYSSYTHLNVYLHAVPEGAQIEVRYGKVTPLLFKQFNGTRNDKLANKLIEDIEQELLEAK